MRSFTRLLRHKTPIKRRSFNIRKRFKYFSSQLPDSHPQMNLRVYTREEVGKHNTPSNGWVIIHNKVYNVTKWIEYHPGGETVLKDRLGKDITVDFEDKNHTEQATDILKNLLIGEVKEPKRYTGNEHDHGLYNKWNDLY